MVNIYSLIYSVIIVVMRVVVIEQANDKNMLNNWLIKVTTLFDVFLNWS